MEPLRFRLKKLLIEVVTWIALVFVILVGSSFFIGFLLACIGCGFNSDILVAISGWMIILPFFAAIIMGACYLIVEFVRWIFGRRYPTVRGIGGPDEW